MQFLPSVIFQNQAADDASRDSSITAKGDQQPGLACGVAGALAQARQGVGGLARRQLGDMIV